MRLDFSREETPTEYDADVCVVGAGAAGYTLAHELRASGLRVLVVVGGRTGVHEAEQTLYEAEIAGLPYVGRRIDDPLGRPTAPFGAAGLRGPGLGAP